MKYTNKGDAWTSATERNEAGTKIPFTVYRVGVPESDPFWVVARSAAEAKALAADALDISITKENDPPSADDILPAIPAMTKEELGRLARAIADAQKRAK